MDYSEEELISVLINSRNFTELKDTYSRYFTRLKDYIIFVFDNEITNAINQKPLK